MTCLALSGRPIQGPPGDTPTSYITYETVINVMIKIGIFHKITGAKSLLSINPPWHRRHRMTRKPAPEIQAAGRAVDARPPTRQPRPMTLTNSFIAELIRDANRLDRLDGWQKRRMLERAVTTIRDMRETIGIPSGPGRDSLVDIHTIALSIERGWRSDEEIRNALLQAAAMIRDLHIVLDSKTEISLVKQYPKG